MRVEQLIGSYESNRRQAQSGGRPVRFGNKARTSGPGVVDALCLSERSFIEDFGWFSAYVLDLPADVVVERIKQLFSAPSSADGCNDDCLVEKLMFEVF